MVIAYLLAATVPADVGRAAEPASATVLMVEPRATGSSSRSRWSSRCWPPALSAQGDWRTWQLWLQRWHVRREGSAVRQATSRSSRGTTRSTALLLGFGFTAIIFSLILSVAMHYLSGAIRLQTPGPEDHPVGAPAPHRAGVRVHGAQGRRVLAGSLWTGVLRPRQQVHRRVLHRRACGAAGQDDPVLDRDRARARGARQHLAAQRAAAGDRLRRAARAEHPDRRHLPGDRAAGHRQAERQHQGSALHRAQHPGHPAGVRDRHQRREDSQRHGGLQRPTTRRAPTRRSALSRRATRPCRNIRILDPNVLSPTFTQQQAQQKNFYGFPAKLDIDRYDVDGRDERLRRRRARACRQRS